MTKPIDLYYWGTPNGKKISIALEEMGLAYTTHFINIGKGEQFQPHFLAVSPNNRIPAIVDHDGPGGQPISVFESGAILQYLGRKTGQFYPADERARVLVDEWLFWQVGGLGPMAGQANHFRVFAAATLKDQNQLAYGAARYTNETKRLFGVLEKQLEGRDYIAGDYSIADMATWTWAKIGAMQGVQFAEFPNVSAWLERVGARPAVIKGAAVAPPGA